MIPLVSIIDNRPHSYVKTYSDEWADAVTRLAGDNPQMDDVEQTLIAMKRAGVLSAKNMGQILVNYLREKQSRLRA